MAHSITVRILAEHDRSKQADNGMSVPSRRIPLPYKLLLILNMAMKTMVARLYLPSSHVTSIETLANLEYRNDPHANTSRSDLFSTSPNKTYIGDLFRYDDNRVDSICPGNSTLTYGVMISTGFFEALATRPNLNYTSLCGHKIWASGIESNGTGGTSTQEANLTLTVFDRCKFPGLRQPFDIKWRIDQEYRPRMLERRYQGRFKCFDNAGRCKWRKCISRSESEMALSLKKFY